MKKTLLVGCGNIGFRHLQALCSSILAADLDLLVIEPNTDYHARITDELARTPVGHSQLLTVLPSARTTFDLVIIATNADVRARVFHDLADKHNFNAIIFEKVLFQRISDLNAVTNRLGGVAAYVNCGRRGFPGYQMLREKLDGAVNYSVVGTQYALASNAIHFLDIAACLNGSPLVSLDVSGLETDGADSKRAGYVEIYGTLTGQLENGAKVSLTCTPGNALSLDITFSGGSVNEAAGTATLNGKTLPFETRHVSGMPYLYEALLRGKPCLLPTFAESADQHRLLLSAINAHLGLPDDPDTLCPIS